VITLAATFLDLHAAEHPTTHVPTEASTSPARRRRRLPDHPFLRFLLPHTPHAFAVIAPSTS